MSNNISMPKKINTNIYSSRFKDLCTYMRYARYRIMKGVAGMLVNDSIVVTEVNDEIIFNYTRWNPDIITRDNDTILKKFVCATKEWLARYLENDECKHTWTDAIHDDIYTKDGDLNKKSSSCSPSMKVNWDSVAGDISEIEGECPTTGEILLWIDYLSGLSYKTLLETYGQKMVNELIGMPANPFIVECEKSYRESVTAKQIELSNIENEINVKWRKEIEAARQAGNIELKKLEEEHDAQIKMLRMVK